MQNPTKKPDVCGFCNKSHGMIGDVVCPYLQRFPTTYTSKKMFYYTDVPLFEIAWPMEQPILLKFFKVDNTPILSDEEFKAEFARYRRSNGWPVQ